MLDAAGRIVSTREPEPAAPGPAFHLVRGPAACAWAVHARIAPEIADQLDRLARDEPPAADLRADPVYAERYRALLRGQVRSGPAFRFPETLPAPEGIIFVEDEAILARHFAGWVAGEIAAGRGPVAAVAEDGYPVSVCMSSRRTDVTAEAGLETAAGFRGRGFASRVAAAWAIATRAAGRIPLYSTDWSNAASRAVARKLHLELYALDWSVSG